MKKWLNILAIVGVMGTALVTAAGQAGADGGSTAAVEAAAADSGPAGSGPIISDGETWFAVLATLLMSVVSPLTTAGLKKLNIIDPKIAAATNIAVGVAYYLLAWLVLHGRYPSLPQDPLVWIAIGATGSGLGQAGRSTWKNLGAESGGGR